MIIPYDKKSPVTRPEDIAKLLQAWLKTVYEVDRDKEHFIAILLNTRSKIKNIEVISIGIVNACLIHPREVFKRAIMESSSQIIIAHNHPSEDCEPSNEDIEITKRLKEAGTIVGIDLLDHIVFSSQSYYSFSQNGILMGYKLIEGGEKSPSFSALPLFSKNYSTFDHASFAIVIIFSFVVKKKTKESLYDFSKKLRLYQ